jgi:hypothetical protein
MFSPQPAHLAEQPSLDSHSGTGATRAEARADIFDYIERWHNPRQRRRVACRQEEHKLLTQLSVETG